MNSHENIFCFQERNEIIAAFFSCDKNWNKLKNVLWQGMGEEVKRISSLATEEVCFYLSQLNSTSQPFI